ncbi:MAG: rhomboid family intramembrane serine protease [Planctomycetaceae bacterium]|jgi:membrane associated rhomboid family serine protease|nr:rhomboid family intramembrane serine protease [Planctomycetaceae bacterium]
MGFSDRDYNRFDRYDMESRRKNGWTMTTIIIAVNVALWLINGLLCEKNELNEALLLKETYVLFPESCYRFLTYGFVHDPHSWQHIVFNMLALAMFGYGLTFGIGPGGFALVRGNNVEAQLGKREFLAFYLLTILLGGITFAVVHAGQQAAASLGASGGVCGVVILYAWMFPRQMIFIWGVIPMPMWGLGLLIVFMDASGSAGYGAGGIAYSVHLAGAVSATLYYLVFFRSGYRFTDLLKDRNLPKRKFNLKIYPFSQTKPPINTDAEMTDTEDADDDRRLDEILGRYGEVGESGLTEEERRFLQKASRKYAAKYRK